MFDPQSHYTNSRTIYKALKKLLDDKYYGNMTKSQKEKLDEKYGEHEDINIETPDSKDGRE